MWNFPAAWTAPSLSIMAHGVANGQPGPPFASENLRAGEKLLRQPNAPRIVLTKRPQCHDGQPLFARLKTKIRPIQMKPQLRVESQPRIAAHDQQQLVERRDGSGQLGPIAQHSPAIDDPARAAPPRAARPVAAAECPRRRHTPPRPRSARTAARPHEAAEQATDPSPRARRHPGACTRPTRAGLARGRS